MLRFDIISVESENAYNCLFQKLKEIQNFYKRQKLCKTYVVLKQKKN